MPNGPPGRRRFLAASTTLLTTALAGCPLSSGGTDATPDGAQSETTPHSAGTPTREPTATLRPTATATETPTGPATPDPSAPPGKLVPTTERHAEDFGTSLAVAGERALVGASPSFEDPPVPPAISYQHGDGEWQATGTLQPDTDAPWTLEDWCVGMDGSHAIVAGQEEPSDGEYAATLYFFIHDGTGWERAGKRRLDVGERWSRVSRSVSVAGDRALLGATTNYTTMRENLGLAYVLEREEQGWTVSATLPPDGTPRELGFGHTVSLAEDAAIVGSFEGGTATVYERRTDGWTETTELSPDGAHSFGETVALADGRALVADPVGGSETDVDGGAVYAYERDDSGWSRTGVFRAEEPTDHARFGAALAMTATTAIVGEPDSAGGGGAVYRFERETDGWRLGERLQAPDGDASDRFGAAVALSDEYALVGATGDEDPPTTESGAAYVFEL